MRCIFIATLALLLSPTIAAAQVLDCGKLPDCDGGGPILNIRPSNNGGGHLLRALEGACIGKSGDECSDAFVEWTDNDPERAALRSALPGFAEELCSDEHAEMVRAIGLNGAFQGIGPVAAGDADTARCVVGRFLESAPEDWFPAAFLPEVDDEVVLMFGVMDAASDLETLPTDMATRLFAATIVHGAWELPQFLETARQDPVRAGVALVLAGRALADSITVAEVGGRDVGERFAAPADAIFALASRNRLAASALMARATLAVPGERGRTAELPGYTPVDPGRLARSEAYWGDASGHFDFWGDASGHFDFWQDVTEYSGTWGDASGHFDFWGDASGHFDFWQDAAESYGTWGDASGHFDYWSDASGYYDYWADASGHLDYWADASGHFDFWDDATGHYDFHARAGRRAGLDHIGAYNFMVEISGVNARQVVSGAPLDGSDAVVVFRKRPGRVRSLDSDFYVDVDVTRVDGADQLSVRGTGWGFPPTLLDRGEAGDNIAYFKSVDGVGDEVTLGSAFRRSLDSDVARDLNSNAYAAGDLTVSFVIPVEDVFSLVSPQTGWRLVREFPALALVAAGR